MKEINQLNANNDFEAIRQASAAKKEKPEEITKGLPKISVTPIVSDEVNVSEKATEVNNLVKKLDGVPDIRQERVEAFKKQINRGEYQPSSKDIAEALLKSEF
jgi:flagellar biosynthesis anti-sigma factor FlgM